MNAEHEISSDTQDIPIGFNLTQMLKGHTDVVDRIAWSPDGRLLASPSRDRSVRVWAWEGGTSERILTGYPTWVNCVAWSPDGNFLVTGSESGHIKVWNTAGWKELTVKSHGGRMKKRISRGGRTAQ